MENRLENIQQRGKAGWTNGLSLPICRWRTRYEVTGARSSSSAGAPHDASVAITSNPGPDNTYATGDTIGE